MQAIFKEVKKRELEERQFSLHSSICIGKYRKFNEMVAKWSGNWSSMRSRVMELFNFDDNVMPPGPSMGSRPGDAHGLESSGQAGSCAFTRKSASEACAGSCSGVDCVARRGIDSNESATTADSSTGMACPRARPETRASLKLDAPCRQQAELAALAAAPSTPTGTDGEAFAIELGSHASTAALNRSWNILERDAKHGRTCMARNETSRTDRLHKQMQDVVVAIISAYVAA